MRNSRLVVCAAVIVGAAGMLSAQRPGGGRGPEGFGGGPGLMSAWPGWRTPVTGVPYSGVETTQVQRKLDDGNQIARQDETKVYRDGQGRVRMEHTGTQPGSNQQARTFITIFDPVAGYSYVLNPQTKKAMKRPLPTGERQGAGPGMGRGPRKDAKVQTEDLGTQTINGLAATGTRTTRTIPAGAVGNQQPIVITRETWISTALKVPVQIKTSDPRFGSSTLQLTSVVQAEPDPTLFQVPSDYTVTEGPGRGRGAMNRPMGNRLGQRI
jgi:hypothetical protein